MAEPRQPRDIAEALRDAEIAAVEYEKEIALYSDDEIEQRRALAAQEKLFARGRGDVQQTLKMPEARRFLHRILLIAGAYTKSFVPGAPDVTAHNEGKRAVGVDLIALLEDAEPGIVLKMQREYLSDLKSRQAREQKEMEARPQ
jgi:hypothetical protein